MNSEEAKALLLKLDELNREIDLLSEEINAVYSETGETLAAPNAEDAASRRRLKRVIASMKDSLGEDFVKRSFW